MTAFLIRRIALAVVTFFAVLTLVFVIVRILPGDPAQLILGDQASREAIEALRVRLGLDQPIATQYLTFLVDALRGDWGVSMVTGRSVLAEVLDVLPWTLELTVVSLALGVVLGVPLGVWAAVRRNRFVDYVMRMASLAGLSFPAFVAAIILLFLFAIELRWFPVISAHKGSLKAWTQSITLPAISLGLNTAAYITRVTRSAMLEVLSEDYVRTARAKGVPERVVVWRHAFRNAVDSDHHRRRALYVDPDRQFGADRDRLQSPRPRQADRRGVESARLHDARGHDGDLYDRRRRRESAFRSRLRLR